VINYYWLSDSLTHYGQHLKHVSAPTNFLEIYLLGMRRGLQGFIIEIGPKSWNLVLNKPTDVGGSPKNILQMGQYQLKPPLRFACV